VERKTKKGYQPYEHQEISTPKNRAKKGKNARNKAILAHLALYIRNPKAQADKNWSISRVVWRAGVLQLAEALPDLAKILEKSHKERDVMLRYCTLWSIARCGMTADSSQKAPVQPVLSALAESEGDALLYHVCSVVFSSGECAAWRENLLQKLPPSFQHQIKQKQTPALLLTLQDYVQNRPKSHFLFVEYLHALAEDDPSLRPAVLWFAQHAPFKSGFFKVLRHLYKMAEMRLDAELFGVLTQRFVTEKAQFAAVQSDEPVEMMLDGQQHKVQQRTELAKADSRLAYSDKTRNWFIRRSLNTLLNTLEQPGHVYVKMATGLLLAVDDAVHQTKERSISRYTYNEQAKRWDSTTTVFPQYSDYPAFFYVLKGAHPQYQLHAQGTEWGIAEPQFNQQSNKNWEAHPELWDACPQAYVYLMAESQTTVVQDFALRRFKAHPQSAELTARFDTALLRRMLERRYRPTALFALDLLERRFDPQQPDRELVLAMLDNPHAEVRQKGHDWLRANLSVFVRETAFVYKLLTHDSADVRVPTLQSMLEIARLLSETQQHALLGRILAYLLALEPLKGVAPETESGADLPEALAGEQIAALKTWATALLPGLSLDLLKQLLQHPLETVAALGADLMVQRAGALPDEALQCLLDSRFRSIQQQGIALLQTSAQPRRELLLANLAHEHPSIRAAVYATAISLIDSDPDFTERLLGSSLNLLLRKEAVEGVHEEIREWLVGHLAVWLPRIERKTIFRLLNSQQVSANTLASYLIQQYVTAEHLSVRSIVRMGNHELLAVRQVSQRMFTDHIARMQYEREDAVLLLESDWDDTRAFAFDYFRTQFGAREWTLEMLMRICDSGRPDVQVFGQELAGRYLREEDGPTYLLQLSQHPKPEMQAYAARYLEQYAANTPEYLDKLSSFCTTVLAQVNKNRKAKEMVFDFLQHAALRSEQAAQEVAAILERASLTTVQTDKTRCIELMRDVRDKYPGVLQLLT